MCFGIFGILFFKKKTKNGLVKLRSKYFLLDIIWSTIIFGVLVLKSKSY